MKEGGGGGAGRRGEYKDKKSSVGYIKWGKSDVQSSVYKGAK